MLKALSFCLLLLIHAGVLGQELKPVKLEEITVYGSKIPEGEIGVSTTFIDSLILTQSRGENFAELLRKIGAGQIRSYGVSGLSTPSFRGTSGSQTSILWNGIPLNSSLNGSSDISQIPVSGTDQIKIQKGGASSLYGSGAIGGTIQIDSRPSFVDQTSVVFTSEIGSFGRELYQIHTGISSSKEHISVTFYNRSIENDYPFLNQYKRPAEVETRTNARYQQNGFINNIDFRLGKKQVLGIKLWTQSNEYQVPNSILASGEADALQKDESIRSLIQWSYGDGKKSYVIKQAFIHHGLHFTEPSAQIDSKTTYGAWTNRFEGTSELKENLTLLYGINHMYEYAGEENFGKDPPQRNTTSLFSSLRYNPDTRTRFALNVRRESVDGVSAPIAPSFGLEHQVNSSFSVEGNISRNYRLPTFNDLYWQGAGGFGNSSLLPESAWGGDITVNFHPQTENAFNLELTAHSQTIENWILWRPVSLEGWSPDNVKKVWSRGLEVDAFYKVKIGMVDIQLDGSYRFTRTINEEVSSANFILELNKQLIYTPIHEYSQRVRFSFSGFDLMLRYNYVGEQFTEGENKSVFALDAYDLIDTSIQYQTKFKKFDSRFYFKADNLLDVDYENRRGFPMYGRNFSLGMTLQIQSNN